MLPRVPRVWNWRRSAHGCSTGSSSAAIGPFCMVQNFEGVAWPVLQLTQNVIVPFCSLLNDILFTFIFQLEYLQANTAILLLRTTFNSECKGKTYWAMWAAPSIIAHFFLTYRMLLTLDTRLSPKCGNTHIFLQLHAYRKWRHQVFQEV